MIDYNCVVHHDDYYNIYDDNDNYNNHCEDSYVFI